ncbi:MAG TPA: response regulator [Steroidobacteraceae bacterium]|nr:response regulator [Steroidobacteraceae bacterium]
MGNHDKVNILLVDDQPGRLLTYESVLEELGQNLVPARSGLEALEKLMQDEFAVVLLDVSMPDMDGFEAARLIHEHPRFEKTPIIFVTGVHVSEFDKLRGYKVGAVDYVSLPIVPEILRSKVAVLVELYLKRRELREANRNLAQANAQLAQANTTLQAEKTRELEALNLTLQRANAKLEHANLNLQNEVFERARVEEALKEANRHKDEFLAMLAHELRNPLAPILNAVRLIRMRRSEATPIDGWVEIIERQVTHLTRLVDDLLDVSRITRGKINLAREPIELQALIARTAETVEPLMQERSHHLTLDVPDGRLRVNGDPLRLTQVLGNVLANAAKYTEPGGHIRLTTLQNGTDLEIRICDDGIGIPADLLPVIFNLFTQVDRTYDRTHGGLGIGLALVRKLLDMHGGTITAHSEGMGKGSEFVIRLPLLMDRTSETGLTLALDPTGAGSVTRWEGEMTGAGPALSVPTAPTRRRILVADDNADALESLAMLLELGGHEVFSAANGAVALESAEQHRPEVALLDIGMPQLDGYEVARRIRAQSWGSGMTLVALTGWGQDSDRRRSREAGFDSHLVKPLDLDRLSELLAKLPTPRGPEPEEERNVRRGDVVRAG